MFYHDKKLQYTVRVDTPSPFFAKMLQQALGGIEGEVRIMLQYLFQSWNFRGPQKYRDMLLETGTEEIGHVEMLATAIAMNLEGSPAVVQEEAAKQSPMVAAVMGGMAPRQFLSGGMGAVLMDSQGVPFNGSWVISSGNWAADLHANIEAESTGRLLVSRLYEMTDDPGMKDMCSFLIARDGMHQNQWLAVLEELGGTDNYPIPNSFDISKQPEPFGYTYYGTGVGDIQPPTGRFTSGPSMDGRSEFKVDKLTPQGEEPQLAPAMPQAHAQMQEMPLVDKVVTKAKDLLD